MNSSVDGVLGRAYPPEGFTLRVTQPSGRSHTHGADGGRTVWKLHAVRAGEKRAACGLLPKLGWGVDLFEDEMDDCKRCLVSTGSCSACFGDGRVRVLVDVGERTRHYERADCVPCGGTGARPS